MSSISGYGINLYRYCNENDITGNHISDNQIGINFSSSSNINMITFNNISNNVQGIVIIPVIPSTGITIVPMVCTNVISRLGAASIIINEVVVINCVVTVVFNINTILFKIPNNMMVGVIPSIILPLSLITGAILFVAPTFVNPKFFLQSTSYWYVFCASLIGYSVFMNVSHKKHGDDRKRQK